MKKMSIIRFKPKNGCMDEFIEASLKFSKDRGTAVPPTHFLMKSLRGLLTKHMYLLKKSSKQKGLVGRKAQFLIDSNAV